MMRKEVVRITLALEVPVAMEPEAFDDLVKEMVATLRHEPDIELASLTHDRKDN